MTYYRPPKSPDSGYFVAHPFLISAMYMFLNVLLDAINLFSPFTLSVMH